MSAVATSPVPASRTGRRLRRPSGALPTLVLLALAQIAVPAASSGSGASGGAQRTGFQGEGFYEMREAAAQRAQERGDHREAVRQFEIAAFGLLEDPPRLAGVLVRSCASLVALDRREDFAETVLRIAELEDRFGAYGEAELDPDQRAAFESTVLDRGIVVPGPLSEILARRELEQSTAAEASEATASRRSGPTQEQLRARLLEDHLAGRQRRATRSARQLVAEHPQDLLGACYLAATERRDADSCSEVLTRLEPCDGTEIEALVVAARAQCRQLTAPSGAAASEPASQDPPPGPESDAIAESGEALSAAPAGDQQRGRQAVAPPLSQQADVSRPSGDPVDEPSDRGADPVRGGSDVVTTGADDEGRHAVDVEVGSDAEMEPSLGSEIAELRRAAAAARTADELEPLLERALQMADSTAAGPAARRSAHRLAGEIAYRAARWATAVRHLTQDGDPQSPAHLFYLAVSLWEVGYRQAARQALRRALPDLLPTPFVEARRRQMLGDGP
ncbi:MAG: hypothetical protein DWQ36_05070 [Acidobacteria bacterium]|nr:MAG: hypothetical protein DWQ30_10450 [Acidobacteriota bacterium]REK10156.1 MAG: hypothetical protein DWQ36_05070 [Acidobacteriota bacterium]